MFPIAVGLMLIVCAFAGFMVATDECVKPKGEQNKRLDAANGDFQRQNTTYGDYDSTDNWGAIRGKSHDHIS